MFINATDLAALAVVIDSVVTIGVGRRLIRTAEKETAKAAETVTPVIKEHLEKAIVSLLPLITSLIQKEGEKRIHSTDSKPVDTVAITDNKSTKHGFSSADIRNNLTE